MYIFSPKELPQLQFSQNAQRKSFPAWFRFFLFFLPIFIFIQLVSFPCPLGDSPSPPPLQTIILKDIGIKMNTIIVTAQ
jgi:hypothetical protein